jgi:radical SAM superfamily enzyme YgiQ (UPF0313 family)
MNKQIILSSINARYTHTSFGIRWLYANLGDLENISIIKEYNINQPAMDIVENILLNSPKIVTFSIYIWNLEIYLKVIKAIKKVKPEIKIIIGGPEASFEYEGTDLYNWCVYLVCGEGEEVIPKLLTDILQDKKNLAKIIKAKPVDVKKIKTPYHLYSDEDIKNRLVYVEASRGCPFGCEFCLSSLDKKVRNFPIDDFISDMKSLIDRGVKHFKFVDRTFNIDKKRIKKLFDFYLENWRDGMQLHFEIVPDKADDELIDMMAKFPFAGLHLEIGIQSTYKKSLDAISRKQNNKLAIKNIKKIRQKTKALVHADLVAGLPYETMESFANGFNELIEARPHQIQVGILKKLKGAPIARHQEVCDMKYSENPAYEILQTNTKTFMDLQEIKRFARYFDIFYNAENFPKTIEILIKTREKPFNAFMDFSKFIWEKTGQTHKISLVNQIRFLFDFLTKENVVSKEEVVNSLEDDYFLVPGRSDKLHFLREQL